MRTKVLNSKPERTLAVIFDEGEEVAGGLAQVAESENISAGRFTGIGALSKAVVGFFDPERREYVETHIDEQVEVLSLVGNFALKANERRVHAHIVMGQRDAIAKGGHLLKAWVRPTLEIIVVESPGFLSREIDPGTGLPLIRIG